MASDQKKPQINHRLQDIVVTTGLRQLGFKLFHTNQCSVFQNVEDFPLSTTRYAKVLYLYEPGNKSSTTSLYRTHQVVLVSALKPLFGI